VAFFLALAGGFAARVARRRRPNPEAAGMAVARVLEAARDSLLARHTDGSALERSAAGALLLA
jgi:hypothetical protein